MLSTPLRFLTVLPAELRLSSVLKSGQSFRWHRLDQIHATRITPQDDLTALSSHATAEGKGEEEINCEWAFGWDDRTVVLRQVASGIYYRSLYPFVPAPHTTTSYFSDLQHNTTLPLLLSYFQLDTKIVPLYEQWKRDDKNFAKKIEKDGEGGRLEGIRVLKQDSWETLVSFICSSNNNIARITLMVNALCRTLGTALPHPSSFTPATIHTASSLLTSPPSPPSSTPSASLYSFPPPTSLISPSTDALLRSLGFGYRAPYILSTSLTLLAAAQEADLGPLEYLKGLEKVGLAEAREKLIEFKGVGRKVADCVALFGLGYSQVVPVDTHVFQIAVRDYSFPASKSATLTPVLHDKVADKLSGLWGPHAGWAQAVLFYADLKPTSTSTSPTKKGVKKEKVVVKAKWEIELEEFEKSGKGKRSRASVKVEKSLEVEEEEQEDYPTPKSLVVMRKVKVKTEEESPSKRIKRR